jgi:hypothetical protein
MLVHNSHRRFQRRQDLKNAHVNASLNLKAELRHLKKIYSNFFCRKFATFFTMTQKKQKMEKKTHICSKYAFVKDLEEYYFAQFLTLLNAEKSKVVEHIFPLK